MIKSISYKQDDIFDGITTMFCPDGFECDPTYSKGIFYKNIPKPKYKYDLSPQTEDTIQADSCNLPLEDNLIKSIMFDPPFCFGIHGKTLQNISAKRFTMYKNFEELENHYKGSLLEFKRILIKKGILVFKCQDYTDSKTTMTHCLVWKWATDLGFYAKDLFILLNESRIWNPNLTQRHARKCHSYFWVFENINTKRRALNEKQNDGGVE